MDPHDCPALWAHAGRIYQFFDVMSEAECRQSTLSHCHVLAARPIVSSGSACHARAAQDDIAGFGCKPPSLDSLPLPSAEITEGGPKQNLGTEALSRAEPK